jgi:hypothetical protein
MISKPVAGIAIASLIWIAGSAVAVASGLPAAYCAVSYGGALGFPFSGGGNPQCPQSVTYNNPGRAGVFPSGSASASASGMNGFPSASASTTLGPGLFVSESIGADAAVEYYLQVIGPPGTNGTVVPTVASGTVSAQGVIAPANANTTGGTGFAMVQYGTHFTDTLFSVEALTNGSSSDIVPYSETISLTEGNLYKVSLLVSTILASPTSGTDFDAQSLEVTADPTFTLSPAFTARGYSLEYSPGFTPVVSTPEPTPLWLLCTGLALLFGETLYRRLTS